MKKRKKYFIDHGFQVRMITRVALLIIGAFVISGILSYIISVQIEKASDFELYGTTAGNLNDIIMLSSLFIVKPTIIRTVITGGILGIILACISMLFYSHRLAGPVYRIEQHIKEMMLGNFDNKLVFRKKDEFKQLADMINKLQEKIKELK